MRMRSALAKVLLLLTFCGSFFLGAGCQTPGAKAMTAEDMVPPVLVLVPGDVLDIKFPGAANLSGQFKIGPEGLLSMPLIGQVQAEGKTAQELQEYLIKAYENQLQDKEVVVTLASSANMVYVTGSVGRPGRIPMDRALTALDAIMEAGGFNLDQANMKKVTVIRYEGEQNVVYRLNLAPIMTGGPVPPFYLQPRDIVHVPQKVQWF
jgi:polysaccharide biosynthesis/export protein